MEKLIVTFDNSWMGGCHYEFEINGNVVGECCVCNADNYIHSLCIYPQFRNHGYARMMLRAVMKLFAGQHMWLRTYIDNIPAIKAYSAVGFNITSTNDKYGWYSMEMTAPKSEMKMRTVYGLSYSAEEYSFDNESDRNEFALSLWQEHSYALWARALNWYDEEMDAEKACRESMEYICAFEVIHVEEN